MNAFRLYLLAALISTGSFLSCMPESAPKTENTHAEGADDEISLSAEQVKTSGITLGSLSLRKLDDAVYASGYTKIPPQNQAEVSVFIGGLVRSIHVIEGDYVKAGQVLAVIESPEFVKLQESYLVSKSRYLFLSEEYKRQQILARENVNAQKVWQQTESDYLAEKARFESLERQLRLLGLPTQGEITAQLSLKAPLSGYITEIAIAIGTSIQPNIPVFRIVQNDEIHVDLMVYEKDLLKVKPGQSVRFELTNQDSETIAGQVFNVGKAFTGETKAVAVHAEVLRPTEELISGMYVNAVIETGSKEVQALPSAAIVKSEGQPFIFVWEESESTESLLHFHRVAIETGSESGEYTEVKLPASFPAGAKIVIKGAYVLQSAISASSGGDHAH